MIPFFFFGLFDGAQQEETLASPAKPKFKGRKSTPRADNSPTIYVDDSIAIPKRKKKLAQTVAKTFKPYVAPVVYQSDFINALENSHIKVQSIINAMVEQGKLAEKARIAEEARLAEEARIAEEQRQLIIKQEQEAEDEAIVMLLFEMI